MHGSKGAQVGSRDVSRLVAVWGHMWQVHGAQSPVSRCPTVFRCYTAACLGGENMSCYTGTGPFCATCLRPAQYSASYQRCMDCDGLEIWAHFLIWLAFFCIMLAILFVLVYKTIQVAVRGCGCWRGMGVGEWVSW